MKKLLWFLCIYNLILIFASFPSYAVVIGGYCHPNGPNGIGINTKNFKPFENDKQNMILYENEWAMVFSNANMGKSYSTSDNRYIEIKAEMEPHSFLEPHEVTKECNSSNPEHEHSDPHDIPVPAVHTNHGTLGPWTVQGGGCQYKSPCKGKACTKLNSFKYPNPMMAIQVDITGPVFVVSDSLNESSIVKNFNYTSIHGLVGGSMTDERSFLYIVQNIADIKNDYLSGAEGDSSEDGNDDSDDEDDSWDVDEDGDYDPDDWDEETDPDTGHTTSTYKWAELEELAGSASGTYKSKGTITYSSPFNMDNTYPLSGTSDQWFTDGVNLYYKYSEGQNPNKKWVKQGSNWWFITGTSRTSIELQLPPTEANPATGDPGGEERTKEISVWEVNWATSEYLLISDGAEYKLYEFDGEGYLTADTSNGYKGAKFNKNGKVIKS